jgi:LPXTG-motif cell wall-anchored protein
LNVANPRENTLNAVTIIPFAPGIKFSPDQYYIGTMDPDEVFTISFGIESGIPGKPIKGPVNLSFISEFKNGDTWHRSGAYVTSYVPPIDSSKQNNYLLPAIAAALILLAAGFYIYRRKRIPGKPKQNGPGSA